ncbi:Nucleotide-diphospho-sugar transferases protein [Dioscorea alata]|uniref:Nucleotide-diphospho-sugar transferases protein n=1 Tax=Dioscorea alata TaxID=55571 RepID=A0ACB7WVH6_DIOAL|nr:Nucleotide-diphospho-sugar transferases protein [Dioscorea alata]
MEEMKKKKKKKKVRSSIKALHNIMINLIPATPNICMQLVSPNYFSSPSLFNSIYYSTPSTMSSSSSIDDHISNDHQDLDFSVQRPAIISAGRFFFSPSFSKSIMEEAKKEQEQEEEQEEEEGEEEEEEGGGGGGGNVLKGLFKESLMMTMVSDDPYQDFRTSMEEMVEAHGVKEWPHLQELLHCYLKLNEKKTHKVILLAFVDLLMQLMAKHDHDN